MKGYLWYNSAGITQWDMWYNSVGYPWYMLKHENLPTGIRFQMVTTQWLGRTVTVSERTAPDSESGWSGPGLGVLLLTLPGPSRVRIVMVGPNLTQPVDFPDSKCKVAKNQTKCCVSIFLLYQPSSWTA